MPGTDARLKHGVVSFDWFYFPTQG